MIIIQLMGALTGLMTASVVEYMKRDTLFNVQSALQPRRRQHGDYAT